MFDDKVVLITGGTGSFGHAFTRKIFSDFSPKKIIIYSRDEFKQYQMSQVFAEYSSRLRFFIGDVRDFRRLKMAFEGVDYVIHAAAMKQVPASEYNPMECIKTNIDGAQNVIEASLACGVQKVIALSTDKAANPINLYGATKLASDKLFVAANHLAGNKPTRFAVARYGNVVGSRGSVVPYFKKLLAEGVRELPVTHKEMTRFWITLDGGVQLVLNAFRKMIGGGIYVPKIPSIRIIDLVKSFGNGVTYKVIGVRPGEKLHEIMCPADDASRTYDFGSYYLIAPTIDFGTPADFSKNALGECAELVPAGFEYHSGNNKHFLTVSEVASLNAMVDEGDKVCQLEKEAVI